MKDELREQLTSNRGFTLIDTLIVFTVYGMLATVIIVDVMNRLERAQMNATHRTLKATEAAVHQYKKREGHCPASLNALICPPSGTPSYLKEKKIPRDAWGSELLYSRSLEDDGLFHLRSKGPDCQEGTDDDTQLRW